MPDTGYTKMNWTSGPLISGKFRSSLTSRTAQVSTELCSALLKTLSCELTEQDTCCVSQVTDEKADARAVNNVSKVTQ